jgi:hypothetical protein
MPAWSGATPARRALSQRALGHAGRGVFGSHRPALSARSANVGGGCGIPSVARRVFTGLSHRTNPCMRGIGADAWGDSDRRLSCCRGTGVTPLTILHLAATAGGRAAPIRSSKRIGPAGRGHRVLLGIIPAIPIRRQGEGGGNDLVGVSDGRPLRARARSRATCPRGCAPSFATRAWSRHTHHSQRSLAGVDADLRGTRELGRVGRRVVADFHNLRPVKRDRLARRLYRRTAGGARVRGVAPDRVLRCR